MKSARPEDFKTVLDFQFWPSRSRDIGVRTHQGSFPIFHFFAWRYEKLSSFNSSDHSKGLSKPSFLNLVKIWWRYWQKTNLELFVDTVYLIVLVLLLVMRKYDGFWPVLHKNKLDHFVLSWEKEAEIEWASNRRRKVQSQFYKLSKQFNIRTDNKNEFVTQKCFSLVLIITHSWIKQRHWFIHILTVIFDIFKTEHLVTTQCLS